jgi:hypothetical protein
LSNAGLGQSVIWNLPGLQDGFLEYLGIVLDQVEGRAEADPDLAGRDELDLHRLVVHDGLAHDGLDAVTDAGGPEGSDLVAEVDVELVGEHRISSPARVTRKRRGWHRGR